MNRIIATGIVADRPTRNCNIYPRPVLERAIKQFNERARNRAIYGGELDPADIHETSEYTHITKRLFMNEAGMLCAEIEVLNNDAGRRLRDRIMTSNYVVARPIMCVPKYVEIAKQEKKEEPLPIVDVHSIVKVQVECNGPESKECN